MFFSYFNRIKQLAEPNLIRYWPLDDRSGTAAKDFSEAYNTPGTYTSATLASVIGPTGKMAPDFDSVDDYVDIIDSLNADSSGRNNLTFSIWAKVRNSGVWTDGANRILCQVRSGPNDYFWIRKVGTTNNRIQVRIRRGGVNTTINIDSITTLDWFNVAFTTNGGAGGDVWVWFNGVFQATDTITNPWASDPYIEASIGKRANGTAQFWNGYLAEAVFCDVHTSDDRVMELFGRR